MPRRCSAWASSVTPPSEVIRQARTAERYAHLRDDPLLVVANRTSDTIAAMLEGENGGTVVPLKSR